MGEGRRKSWAAGLGGGVRLLVAHAGAAGASWQAGLAAAKR